MTIRTKLLTLSFLGIIGWTSWLWIFLKISPYQENLSIIILFLTTLGLAIFSTLSLLIFFIRLLSSGNELFFANFRKSIRQSFLFSLYIILLLILSSFKVLNKSIALQLFLSLLSYELYFYAKIKI